MFASTPDLLRLVAVPVLGWAAWRDVQTRRVPNRTWIPLAALAVALLLWEGASAVAAGNRLFVVQVAISVGFIVPLTTAFWYVGSFGGADAKAFYVLAVLFPTYPVYFLPTVALPLQQTPIGVFSLTILSNTVVVGVAYPVAVALANVVRGHVGWPMLVGKPVEWSATTEEYGVLLETPEGYARNGLDLDALRMYLQWRGVSLADLRTDPDRYRDPSSLPAEPNPPGDGGLAADGGSPVDPSDETCGGAEAPDGTPARDGAATPAPEDVAGDPTSSGEGESRASPASPGLDAPEATAVAAADSGDAIGTRAASRDDPWGAERFLDDLEGSAYGTTAEDLRDGLEVLVDADVVWISPGIPFIVPTFVGLLVSLTYGDVLFALLSTLGVA